MLTNYLMKQINFTFGFDYAITFRIGTFPQLSSHKNRSAICVCIYLIKFGTFFLIADTLPILTCILILQCRLINILLHVYATYVFQNTSWQDIAKIPSPLICHLLKQKLYPSIYLVTHDGVELYIYTVLIINKVKHDVAFTIKVQAPISVNTHFKKFII